MRGHPDVAVLRLPEGDVRRPILILRPFEHRQNALAVCHLSKHVSAQEVIST
jgi:hypothetical protein